MTTPVRDIQQDAEAFIMQTLAQRGPCTAAELYNALIASGRTAASFMFLAKLKQRGLVEHGGDRHAITYELTRRGRAEVE